MMTKTRILPSGVLESESESHSVMSDSLQSHELYSPWNSPGQHTGVGSPSLLQGIFPTQVQTQVSGMQVDSLPAEPPGKPYLTQVFPFELWLIFLLQEASASLSSSRVLSLLGCLKLPQKNCLRGS